MNYHCRRDLKISRDTLLIMRFLEKELLSRRDTNTSRDTLLIMRFLDSVMSSGYSPNVCSPLTDPPAMIRKKSIKLQRF